jgi:HD-like signal output (HDOD) protein
MTAVPKPSDPAGGQQEAFAFVQELAAEMTRGKIDLPGFPNIAMRVRQVLADQEVGPEKVVRVISSEPVLAAQLLRMAGAAARNPTGKPIADLRTAVVRVGLDVVRSATFSFALSQMRNVEALKGLEGPLDDLWRRSAAVAAMTYVLARRHTRVNADTALLAGLLHSIGKLYILTRAAGHPALFADQATFHSIVRDWGSPVAKAVLENWGLAEEIVTAVSEFQDFERQHEGPVDLVDVLTIGYLLAAYKEHPESIELNLQNVSACARLPLDLQGYLTLIQESESEIAELYRALGV